jgi:pimeloyl-ACP methyl ester carboxylesterase
MRQERDLGSGALLVLIPGIQGPWQYASPSVDALATGFRVVTFSLGGAAADGLSDIGREVERVKEILDARRVERAILCGISYGGVVATSFAARYPTRTSHLVVASSPGAGWHLRPRHELYARWPLIFGPLFLAESPFRLRAEVAAALPALSDRWRFARWQIATLADAPFSLSKMATRARSLASHDIAADCQGVTAPTLVVTGERELDRVVPVASTATYAQLIPGARSVVLERTGHLGTITRPGAFADLVTSFVRHSSEAVA